MIHTFTIQKELAFFDNLALIAKCMGKSDEEIERFLCYKGYSDQKGHNVLTYIPPMLFPGYEEIKLLHIRGRRKKQPEDVSQFYLCIRMEPLTVINRKQHIRLFECTSDNINKLIKTFHDDITEWFTLNRYSNKRLKDQNFIDRDINSCIEKLADFTKWEAQRVDYTIDVRMNNQDEVNAFVNLAKWSILSNRYTKSEFKSTYGRHYYDYSYSLGNKSKGLKIYNKLKQFTSKKGKYSPQRYQELCSECKNIVRIEFQLLPRGTKKNSTKLESRNIMEFLDETRGNNWILGYYEHYVGFEDFYNHYYVEKLLDEAFPFTKQELADERKRAREAEKAETTYKPKKHSNKYELYRNHISYIMLCKGRDNALKKCLENLTEKEKNAARRKFFDNDKTIRKKAGISTVCIPKSWYYKKNMNLPSCLKNPIQRPACDTTDTP